MDTDFLRDHAMYAAIFGVFGVVWFGWAQENPPKSWRAGLGMAAGLSFLVASVGGYLAFAHWGDASVFNTPGMSRRFGIIVGIEFALASVGAGALHLLRKPQFVAAWIASIVGLHFVPLAFIFRYKPLFVLAALVTLAPVAAIFVAKKAGISAVTLVGAATGSLLVLFAIRELILAAT